jgi:hypothetical protein
MRTWCSARYQRGEGCARRDTRRHGAARGFGAGGVTFCREDAAGVVVEGAPGRFARGVDARYGFESFALRGHTRRVDAREVGAQTGASGADGGELIVARRADVGADVSRLRRLAAVRLATHRARNAAAAHVRDEA